MITKEIIKKDFEKNIIIINKDGSIVVAPEFANFWIITINIPILGNIKCNKIIASDLFKIFYEISKTDNLKDDINIKDTITNGGCYFPRYKYCLIHKKYDECKGISMHSLGLAIDINPSTNPYGSKGTITNMELAVIFQKYNWVWGGKWKTPDPMHFEKIL